MVFSEFRLFLTVHANREPNATYKKGAACLIDVSRQQPSGSRRTLAWKRSSLRDGAYVKSNCSDLFTLFGGLVWELSPKARVLATRLRMLFREQLPPGWSEVEGEVGGDERGLG